MRREELNIQLNMRKLILSMAFLGTVGMVVASQAADDPNKNKKPETVIQETHPDRDHTIDADDVEVKRAKTEYKGQNAHTMNFRLDPLSLLLGMVNLDADFKMGDKWTLGPSLMYWDYNFPDDDTFKGIHIKSWAVGARANFYPGGNALEDHGWYVGPSVQYMSLSLDTEGKASGHKFATETSAVVFKAVGGYHWIWDSFNLMLGGGFGISTLPNNKLTVKDTSNNTESDVTVASSAGSGLALEATIGFAF